MSLNRLLGLNLLIKSLDTLTTLLLVNGLGPEVESNPVTRYMIDTLGAYGGLGLNWALHGILVLILCLIKKKELLWVAAAVTMLFPIINSCTLLLGG